MNHPKDPMKDQRDVETTEYPPHDDQSKDLHVPHSSDNQKEIGSGGYSRDKKVVTGKAMALLASAVLGLAWFIWNRMNNDVARNVVRIEAHDSRINDHEVRLKELETNRISDYFLLREVRDDVKTLLRKSP